MKKNNEEQKSTNEQMKAGEILLQMRSEDSEKMNAMMKKMSMNNNDDDNETRRMKDASSDSEDSEICEKVWNMMNCASCHKPNLGGDIGPNLTDEYWKNGGGIKNVFTTIKYGVKGTSMVSWDGKLNGGQIQQVASFILSKQGSKPEGGLDPEGELYVPSENVASDSTATDTAVSDTVNLNI